MNLVVARVSSPFYLELTGETPVPLPAPFHSPSPLLAAKIRIMKLATLLIGNLGFIAAYASVLAKRCVLTRTPSIALRWYSVVAFRSRRLDLSYA